jgi:hypothetical protein
MTTTYDVIVSNIETYSGKEEPRTESCGASEASAGRSLSRYALLPTAFGRNWSLLLAGAKASHDPVPRTAQRAHRQGPSRRPADRLDGKRRAVGARISMSVFVTA